MATGKVKWFNNAKGYGFILPGDGGEDLFAHYSSIQMDGYKTLKAGQEVEFDVVAGPKGQHAVEIRLAEESSPEAVVADTGYSIPEVILPSDVPPAEGASNDGIEDPATEGQPEYPRGVPGHVAKS